MSAASLCASRAGALRVRDCSKTVRCQARGGFILSTLVTHDVYKRVTASRAESRIPNRKEKSDSPDAIYTCSKYVLNTYLLLHPEVGQSGDQEHVGR